MLSHLCKLYTPTTTKEHVKNRKKRETLHVDATHTITKYDVIYAEMLNNYKRIS